MSENRKQVEVELLGGQKRDLPGIEYRYTGAPYINRSHAGSRWAQQSRLRPVMFCTFTRAIYSNSFGLDRHIIIHQHGISCTKYEEDHSELREDTSKR